MRKIVLFSFWALSIWMFSAVYAADRASQSQIINHQASGNLESNFELQCVGADKLTNKYTPPDLYRALSKCIQAGNYQDGAFLFALAGVYGRFDTLRVADKTAHQALGVLKMQALGSLDADQQNLLKDSLEKRISSPKGIVITCKEMVRIGPPGYYPNYMIQHGMDAFIQGGTEKPLTAGFDPKTAWKQSLESYLHCTGV